MATLYEDGAFGLENEGMSIADLMSQGTELLQSASELKINDIDLDDGAKKARSLNEKSEGIRSGSGSSEVEMLNKAMNFLPTAKGSSERREMMVVMLAAAYNGCRN